MQAQLIDNKIKLSFKFSWDIVNFVKTIPGRVYDPRTRTWTIPATDENLNLIKSKGFSVPKIEKKKISLKYIPGKFKNYQIKAVEKIVEHKRILLADEMGLGKTAQSIIGVANLHAFPVLVICPASLKLNWELEVNKWLKDRSVQVLDSKSTVDKMVDFIVVNYDVLSINLKRENKTWVATGILNELSKINFKAIILDESHFIKNDKAKRTKAIKWLIRKVQPEVKLALTGTPILNRPIDIYNSLNLLRPDIYRSKWQFAKRYCGLKYNGFGWDMTGHSHEDELEKLLKTTVMIRRTKKEVLKELPDKIYSVIPVEIQNRAEYVQALDDFATWLENKGKNVSRAEALVKIEYLKQLTVQGKIKHIYNWIDDFLETDQKLVVFFNHKFMVDILKQKYKDGIVFITGDMNTTDRQKSIDQFMQNKNVKIIAGTIKAMGVGLTLTASSTVLFVELGWTPSEHDQAEDRVHRIGQKDSVNIYYMIGKETIEQDILELLDNKRKIINKIIDGEDVKQDTLSELLTKITKKGALK